MAITGRCRRCNGVATWIDCPTGGWWAHDVHPTNGHQADLPELEQVMDSEGWLHTVKDGAP